MTRKKRKEPEVFSTHPLARLAHANMLDDFRRETSAVACPNCGAPLYIFVHRPTGWKAFFLCLACQHTGINYCFEELIQKHNPAARAQIPAPGISAALDRVVTSITRNERTAPVRYDRLTGGKRHGRRN